MKKLMISIVLSAPLFLMSCPLFSAPVSSLDKPGVRTDAPLVANNNVSKAGTHLAWYRWHRGYGWHRGYWHRGYGWHRWHWRHWHYY